MHLLCASSTCPQELAAGVRDAGCFSDVFETIRPLAYHSDCFVTVARCKVKGCSEQEVVVKSYIHDRLSPVAKRQVDTEIQIHQSLNHPHIVQLLLAFEDQRHKYLVVEYAEGGDLRKHLKAVTERRVRDFIIIPLLQALAVLQQQGIVHRDLKPENVLVQQNEVRLADFGLAVYADGGQVPCTSSAGGTPLYAAPEVLLAMFKNEDMSKAVGHKNDIWALGVMALEAFTGKHPFGPDHHTFDGNVLYSIAHHTKVALPPILSDDFADWLGQALQRDPKLRPGAMDLLQHPWLTAQYSPGSNSSDSSIMHNCGQETEHVSRRMPVFADVECWEY